MRKRSLRIKSTVYDIPSCMQLSKKSTPIFLCTQTFTLTYYFYDFLRMTRWGYISLWWPIFRNLGIFPLPFPPKQSRWPPNFFFIFGKSNLLPTRTCNFRKEMKQISMWEDFRVNVIIINKLWCYTITSTCPLILCKIYLEKTYGLYM